MPLWRSAMPPPSLPLTSQGTLPPTLQRALHQTPMRAPHSNQSPSHMPAGAPLPMPCARLVYTQCLSPCRLPMRSCHTHVVAPFVRPPCCQHPLRAPTYAASPMCASLFWRKWCLPTTPEQIKNDVGHISDYFICFGFILYLIVFFIKLGKSNLFLYL